MKTKRKSSKRRFTSPSTLLAMDHESDDDVDSARQTRSTGHLGPYDGHGVRGRNLIARIKDNSEYSSSADEDEKTNRRVGSKSQANSHKRT